MISQINGVSIICSTVCSGANQRKHQSSAPLAFVRGIHWSTVSSPPKGPVTRIMFPFDDVIMCEAWIGIYRGLGIWLRFKKYNQYFTMFDFDVATNCCACVNFLTDYTWSTTWWIRIMLWCHSGRRGRPVFQRYLCTRTHTDMGRVYIVR